MGEEGGRGREGLGGKGRVVSVAEPATGAGVWKGEGAREGQGVGDSVGKRRKRRRRTQKMHLHEPERCADSNQVL